MKKFQTLRVLRRSKSRKVMKIIDDLTDVYSGAVPITLVEEIATERGIENPEVILRRLREENIVVKTGPNTIAKLWAIKLEDGERLARVKDERRN